MAFNANQTIVAEYYIAALGRLPEQGGFDYWTAQLDAGMTPAELMTKFLDRNIAEVAARYPAEQTNVELIESIYTGVFGRASDAEGSAFWSAKLDTMSDTEVLAEMLAIAKDPANSVDGAHLAAEQAKAEAALDETVVIVDGETYTLTAKADSFVGTDKSDLFSAEAGTLQSGDIIIDQSSTDNDTLKVTYKTADMASDATISGVENINVNIDAFDGTATTFDADNVSGATITLGSDKLGFNGKAGVTNTDANNVTAGSNVTDITVAGLTTGTVDTGSAKNVAITTAAATDTINTTVNGDVFIATNAALKTVITTTADSVIEYNSAAGTTSTTIEGTSNNELTMEVADITDTQTVTNNSTGTLTLNVNDAGAFNATKFDVDTINLQMSTGAAATVATGAKITTEVAQTSLEIAADVTTAATNAVTLTTGKDLLTSTTFTNIETANIVATADITIDDLATAKDAALSGTADVTVATTNAAKLDASALVGALTLEATTASSEILGGSGNNVVTVGNFDSSYTGKNGNDTVVLGSVTNSSAVVTGNGTNSIDATALTNGTLAVTGGTGADTVKLGATIGTATLAMNGGAGADVILATTAADFTNLTTWAVEGFETLAVKDAVGGTPASQALTINGSQLSSFSAVSIQDADSGVTDDDLAVAVTADKDTTDLSGITVDAATTVLTVTGKATAETIKGTNGNDVIITSGGADKIDLSKGGTDTITIASGESAKAAMVEITGFDISSDIALSDTLDLDLTALASATAVDVKGAITDGTGSEVVTVSIANGIATLDGADKAAIDTLDEWIAVLSTDSVMVNDNTTAETLVSAAFEFGGDTYVVSQADAAAVWSTTAPVMDVVKLVGVTGADALATSVGVNDIVLG